VKQAQLDTATAKHRKTGAPGACNFGLRLETDSLNGMAFLRTHLEPELSPATFQP
jgi:hypothetical protein